MKNLEEFFNDLLNDSSDVCMHKKLFIPIDELNENADEYPFLHQVSSLIPNVLGINLVAVRGFMIYYRNDKQIETIEIIFKPNAFMYNQREKINADKDISNKKDKWESILQQLKDIRSEYSRISKSNEQKYNDKINKIIEDNKEFFDKYVF